MSFNCTNTVAQLEQEKKKMGAPFPRPPATGNHVPGNHGDERQFLKKIKRDTENANNTKKNQNSFFLNVCVMCHLSCVIWCSFSYYESPWRLGDAAAGVLVIYIYIVLKLKIDGNQKKRKLQFSYGKLKKEALWLEVFIRCQQIKLNQGEDNHFTKTIWVHPC